MEQMTSIACPGRPISRQYDHLSSVKYALALTICSVYNVCAYRQFFITDVFVGLIMTICKEESNTFR